MKYIEKIKEMLCTELEVYSKKNAITPTDLERIHKLTDTIKNIDKIMAFEETEGDYSEHRGRSSYGYDDDMMYSERRGRGRNAKRDSMGRYSSDDGSSYDHYDGDMAYARGSKNYSRDDAKDHMMSMLGGMMEDADPNERQILKDAMRKLERA
jgi:hypothetical protein